MVTHPDASIGDGTPNLKPVDGETNDEDGAEDEEEEEDILGVRFSLIWLTIITIFISFLSDMLVNTIESAAKGAGIPGVFIASIVVPIIGNAAEHASAVLFARRNKLDLALGVAVGSSTQIAVMVIPLLVLIGWCSSLPMSLNFQAGEGLIILLSIILVTFALKDGSSNWLLGLILIAAYFIIAASMWGHQNDNLKG
jgi:Ca2+:H+ antiporter